MFILVTNDDGYDAPGLWVAYDLAHKLGGKNARIAVIAPKTEQSGVGHAMTYNDPIKVEKVREDHYLVHGTPTDCVILSEKLLDQKPDLIISGVNRGHNFGPDVLYSGTVGAAIEATAFGIPAFALSQYYKANSVAEFDYFAPARDFGLRAISRIWKEFEAQWPKGVFCNINFPACASEDVKGLKLCHAEPLSRSNMIAHHRETPAGGDYYWLGHPGPIQEQDKNADVALSKEGYVTASFLNLDLGAGELNNKYAKIFDHDN